MIHDIEKIREYLGKEQDSLLNHKCETVSKDLLTHPGPNYVDEVFGISDRNVQALKNISWLYNHGRLSGTGYMSILPVDQGIEHTAGASFAPNPLYFDPENIIKLSNRNKKRSNNSISI